MARQKIGKRLLLVFINVLCIALISTFSLAEDAQQLEQRVKSLEHELKTLKDKNRSRDKKVNVRFAEMEQRIKIHGFASAGLTKETKLDKAVETQDLSRVGVRFSFDVNEKTEVVVQTLSKHSFDNYSIRTDWAYLSYQATRNLTLRAGRISLPFYLFSDYLQVGVAYPWVKPPAELYFLDSTSSELFDLLYRKSVGDLNTLTQLCIGRMVDQQEFSGMVIDIQGDDMVVLNTQLTYHNWTARVGLTQASVTNEYDNSAIGTMLSSLDDRVLALGLGNVEAYRDKIAYNNAGIIWDNGQTMVISEVYESRFSESIAGNLEGIHILAGYRLDDWMPYIYGAKLRTSNDDDREEAIELDSSLLVLRTFNVRQATAGLGIRWDILTGFVMKLQAERVGGFEGTLGSLGKAAGRDHYWEYNLVFDVVF